jgi:lysine-specific demethylase 8
MDPRAHPLASAVPRLTGCAPEAFRRRWVGPAEPVVIAGVGTDWPATARWTLPALRERFSGARAMVMRAPGGRVDNAGPGGTTYDESTLGRYIDALTAGAPDPGYLATMWEELPEDLRADVGWPALCGSPRFRQSTLWFGPEGIVSPMHFDVPDNLYVVVSGRKRFTLVPPRDSWNVRARPLLSGQAQYAGVDPEAPPDARYARAHPRVAELGPGDALYIPRFWWHHARGLELTLAVNFWWGNGAAALLALAADGWKRVRGLSR